MGIRHKMVDYEYENAEDWDLEAEMLQALVTGIEEHEELDPDIAEKLNEAVGVVQGLGLNAELCGCWLWVEKTSRTKAHRETLKANGFRWASRKGQWYFPGKPSGGRRGGKDMTYIRTKYGSVAIRAED